MGPGGLLGVHMRRSTALLVAVTTFTGSGLTVMPAVRASFAGANGVLTYIATSAGSQGGSCVDLYTVQAAGTGRTKLTNCPEDVEDPSWSPSGTRIAVAFSRQPGVLELATLAGTGGSPSFVTTSGASAIHDPSYDAKADVLAFAAGDQGPDSHDIYTVPVGGGTATNLTQSPTGGLNNEPEFAPADNRLVWESRSDGASTWDIVTTTVDANGQNPATVVNLTGSTGNSRWPTWSPDGTKIAFASDRSGSWQIYVMNADGSGVTPITTTAGGNIQPAWSPDGQWIAFTHGCVTDTCVPNQSSNGTTNNGDIQKVNVSSLAQPGSPVTVVATAAAEHDPQWAPACTSTACPAAANVARTATLSSLSFLVAKGSLSVPSGLAACFNDVPVVLELQNIFDRGPNWKHKEAWVRVASGHTSSTGKFTFKLPASLTGPYRVRAPALRLGINQCAPAATATRVNNTVRDRTGDSHGSIDIAWAWVSYRNGVIRHTIRTTHAFATHQRGAPCILIVPSATGVNAAVGCFGGVLYGNRHLPLTIKRPNSRTIVYSFKATELGGRTHPRYSWIAWSRGNGDCDLIDQVPNDYKVCVRAQPWDVPVFWAR